MSQFSYVYKQPELFQQAFEEHRSMRKSTAPSSAVERPTPPVPTTTGRQRQLPNVPSIPPPLPHREDSTEDTYEAPDDLVVNVSPAYHCTMQSCSAIVLEKLY